ncbi:MAG: hypothetical protein ACR652_21430 [Methylocystis sp.]|uniref:hypothetical protein n=1 Tax=Methylocystis sp. TaxID=1911079 RepID=UPI003DA323DD
MRHCARRFYGSLLVAAFLTAAGAAVAQDLQVDPKALDTSGASVQVKRKGKKGADAAAPQPAGKTGAAGGPNRQFGELEGWSPGKAPPKTKEQLQQEERTSSSKSGGVNMSPSGNVGVGLPF